MLINGTEINSVSDYSDAVTYIKGDIVITNINGVSRMYRVNNTVKGVAPNELDGNYSLYASTNDNIISGSEYLSGQKTFNNALEVARYMVSHRFSIIRVPNNFLPGYGYPSDEYRFGFEPTLSNPNDDLSDFIIVSTDDGKKAYAMEINGKIALISTFTGNPYIPEDSSDSIEVANFNDSDFTKILKVDGGNFINLSNHWGLTNLDFIHSDEDEISADDIKCIVRLYPRSISDLNNKQLKVIKVFVEYTFSDSTLPEGRAPYQESIPLFINYPTDFELGKRVQSDGIFCRVECSVEKESGSNVNYYYIQATKLSPGGEVDPTPHPYQNLNKIEIVGIVGLTSI